MWSSQASSQIEAIHSMMASGHRSVHMERHTLIIWGIAAATLILLASEIFTQARFPVTWIRAIATSSFITAVLALVAYLDFRQIRQRRDERAESISFVQRQVMKVWWMLVGLIIVINLAMHFFGGGYMFYSLVLILMGLALYIQGLFSKQMLSIAGVMMILLGLASAGLRLPFPLMEWLAVFCFGLGWPILGISLNYAKLNQSPFYRMAYSLVWLAVVVTPVIIIYQFGATENAPASRPIPLAVFMHETPAQIVNEEVIHLPVGSIVPVNIQISGDVLDGANVTTLPMVLGKSLDIVLQKGKPDGRFRVADGEWKEYKYNYRIRDFSLLSNLDKKKGPEVNLQLYISTNN